MRCITTKGNRQNKKAQTANRYFVQRIACSLVCSITEDHLDPLDQSDFLKEA